MYNRYIPQSDGSYRKNQIHEPILKPQIHPKPKQEPSHAPPNNTPCPPPKKESYHSPSPVSRQGDSAFSFLQRLIPKDLDTGDLLIILLLLLMASDCDDEKNTALLTLALYLFM